MTQKMELVNIRQQSIQSLFPPDPEQAAENSSKKVSILFGATYEGVAIPPLIVFPSKAKNSRMGCKLLLSLKQIQCKFGHRNMLPTNKCSTKQKETDDKNFPSK